MLTNRTTQIILVAVIAAFALLTVSMVALPHPISSNNAKAYSEQRRGEWSAGASAQQAYLDQRYGERTAGNAVDAPQAYLDFRHGEQTAGVNPVVAYLDYRRGEWSGK